MAPQAIVVAALEPTRERAWETLTRYTQSEALRRHALAVEASVGAYARKLGEDEERWRVVALLHDFDYEIHPTLDEHPQDGAPILREEVGVEVEPLAAVPAAELGEVRAGAARDVEEGRRAGLSRLDELVDALRLADVVLPGVDGVVEPRATRKHYAGAPAGSPSSRAIGCSAATTVRMWSSSSTPSSSAPR